MIYIKLNDGNKMPILGYGTYKVTSEEAARCVADALEVGYRLFDTATFYHNEAAIGEALQQSGISRSELFVTTKLWTDVTTADAVRSTVERSLEALRTSYLDLLLIHWPTPANLTVWKAMAQLQREGLVRSIGTSNFKQHHVEELTREGGLVPAVDQVELHPLFRQPDLQDFCRKRGIVTQAWSPLMRSKALEIDALTQLAAKYGVSVAQLILRWDIQQGVATVPKTTNKARMRENFDVFRFEISPEDMRAINALDIGARQYRDPDCHGF